MNRQGDLVILWPTNFGSRGCPTPTICRRDVCHGGRASRNEDSTRVIESAEWKPLSLPKVLNERCRNVAHREPKGCSMKKEHVLKRQSIHRQWAWTRGHWVKWLKNPAVLKTLIILGRFIVWMIRLVKNEGSWPRHFHFAFYERQLHVKRSTSINSGFSWF